MTCPNCNIELEEFSTCKDPYCSNGDTEIYIGRVCIMACPTCGYQDDSSIYLR